MYVCMYVCMYACMYVCMYVSLSLSIYIYIYIYTHDILPFPSPTRQECSAELRTWFSTSLLRLQVVHGISLHIYIYMLNSSLLCISLSLSIYIYIYKSESRMLARFKQAGDIWCVRASGRGNSSSTVWNEDLKSRSRDLPGLEHLLPKLKPPGVWACYHCWVLCVWTLTKIQWPGGAGQLPAVQRPPKMRPVTYIHI